MTPAAKPKPPTAEDARRVLEAQPLVGSNRAAQIMGVYPPNIAKLRQQGRMPAPIEVEGSAAVYLRSEIEKLAEELEAARRERQAKREAG